MLFNQDFPSPNYEVRQKEIKYVIFHYTELPFERAVKKLTTKADSANVSAHFLVKKDGEVFQLVSEDKVAWHAGLSYWRGEDKINHNSIGIEIDNLGREEFTEAQIDSCLKLCAYLKEKYSIETGNFLGHSDIAPSRKIDPGFYFPWKLFADKGFGIRCLEGYQKDANMILYRFGEEGEGVKAIQVNLQKLGYKIDISKKFDEQTNYVVRAFLSRFCPEDLQSSVGIEGYFNLKKEYYWDEKAQFILDSLILNIQKL